MAGFNPIELVALLPGPTDSGPHHPISDFSDETKQAIRTFLSECDFDETMRLVGKDMEIVMRVAINVAFIAHEPRASPPTTETQLRKRLDYWEAMGNGEDGKVLQRIYLDYAVGFVWAVLYRLGEIAQEQALTG